MAVRAHAERAAGNLDHPFSKLVRDERRVLLAGRHEPLSLAGGRGECLALPNTKGMDGGPIVSVAKLPAPLFALTKARFDAAHYANSANLRGRANFPTASGAMSRKPVRRRTNDTALKTVASSQKP